MIQPLLRYGTGVAVLLALVVPALAQEGKDKPVKDKEAPGKNALPPKYDALDPYRELFKKPETIADYWKAMEFELELGSFELAATHLHGLLLKKPTDEQLLELQGQYTMNAFLRLRNIPKWSDDPKADKAARADVEELIKLVTAGVKTQLGNREQIVKWIKALNDSPQESAFALQELFKYKAAAAPPLIDELRKTRGEDRLALIDALRRLSAAVVPPMVAALDSTDTTLVLDLLDILQKRGAAEAMPSLWYLTQAPARPESVHKKATEVLAVLRDTPASRLPGAVPMLVREAEQYYQHKVALTETVTIWRWEGNTVVAGWPGAETVSKSKAEEYYGMRFARQALDLDPTDRAAQVVMLSLTLDKTYDAAGLEKPLAKTNPPVNDLVATVSSDLLTAVLERALNDERTSVVLGAVQALGDRAEVKANKPTGRGEPPLVRALYYPDRRVQMAATESLLHIPGAPSAQARGRMVEILARFLTGEPQAGAKPKALAASGDADTRLRFERAVQAAGFDAVLVDSGRDALKRLTSAADISAILLDSKLPDPGLAYFIGQVEADPNTKKLPVLILAIPDNAETRELLVRYAREEARLDYLIAQTRSFRRSRVDAEQRFFAARKNYLENPVSSIPQQAERLVVLEEGYQQGLRTLARQLPDQAILDREALQIEQTLRNLTLKYDSETARRQDVLKHWAEPYANVQVITQQYLDDTRQLQTRLLGEDRADLKPLSQAEQKDYAERAIRDLGRMAQGDAGVYDVRPAELALYAALRSGTISPEGQLVAIEAVAKFTGAMPQTELATVVVDAKRPQPVRIKATDELVRHVQEHSPLLLAAQVTTLKALADQSATQADLKDLRPHLAALVGSLRPDDRTTGDRLRDFPTPPPTAKPPVEKPPVEKPPADK